MLKNEVFSSVPAVAEPPRDAFDELDSNLQRMPEEASRIINCIGRSEELQEILETMQCLCVSPKQQQQSKGFLKDDEQLTLVHLDTCRLFLSAGLCDALGKAVKNMIETRGRLKAQVSQIEREFEGHKEQAREMAGFNIVAALVDRELGTEGQVLDAMQVCDYDVDAACSLLMLTDQKSVEPTLSREQKRQILKEIARRANSDREEMESSYKEHLRQLSESLERVDVIESLIVLILEQCAVVRPFAVLYFYLNFVTHV
jgi:hypothetical protein